MVHTIASSACIHYLRSRDFLGLGQRSRDTAAPPFYFLDLWAPNSVIWRTGWRLTWSADGETKLCENVLALDRGAGQDHI